MQGHMHLDLDTAQQLQIIAFTQNDRQEPQRQSSHISNRHPHPQPNIMSTFALQQTSPLMPSRFDAAYPQHIVPTNAYDQKPNSAQHIQSLYDAYQQQSNLLALDQAVLSDSQAQTQHQRQQSIADLPSDFQQQGSFYNGYDSSLRSDSTASIISSSAASMTRHSFHFQQQQHDQQPQIQTGMFGQRSPSQFSSSQMDYILPVSHQMHHHSLPLQSPVRPRSGQLSDRSSRERDIGNAPNVVGQEGMPDPAPRPKGPKLKFTPAEDALLVELKEAKGLTWKQIADFFPGRSPGTLQVRYCTKLKAKTTIWTEEMLHRLRSAIAEYENDRWRIISSKVGNGFSATACQEKAMEYEEYAAGELSMNDLDHADSSEDDGQQES